MCEYIFNVIFTFLWPSDITLEYNMDVFILSKVMEMNETEKESFVFELFYNIYCIILKKQ